MQITNQNSTNQSPFNDNKQNGQSLQNSYNGQSIQNSQNLNNTIKKQHTTGQRQFSPSQNDEIIENNQISQDLIYKKHQNTSLVLLQPQQQYNIPFQQTVRLQSSSPVIIQQSNSENKLVKSCYFNQLSPIPERLSSSYSENKILVPESMPNELVVQKQRNEELKNYNNIVLKKLNDVEKELRNLQYQKDQGQQNLNNNCYLNQVEEPFQERIKLNQDRAVMSYLLLCAEMERISYAYIAQEQENEELYRELQALQQKVNEYQNKEKKQQQQLNNINEENEEEEQEQNSVRNTFNQKEMEQQIDDLKQQLEQVTQVINHKRNQSESDNLEKLILKYQQERNGYMQECQKLDKELQNSQHQILSFESQVKELLTSNEQLQNTVDQYVQETQQLKQQNITQNYQIIEMREQQDQQQQEYIKQLEKEISDLQNQFNNAQQQGDKQNKQYEQQIQQIKKEMEKNLKLEAQNQIIELQKEVLILKEMKDSLDQDYQQKILLLQKQKVESDSKLGKQLFEIENLKSLTNLKETQVKELWQQSNLIEQNMKIQEKKNESLIQEMQKFEKEKQNIIFEKQQAAHEIEIWKNKYQMQEKAFQQNYMDQNISIKQNHQKEMQVLNQQIQNLQDEKKKNLKKLADLESCIEKNEITFKEMKLELQESLLINEKKDKLLQENTRAKQQVADLQAQQKILQEFIEKKKKEFASQSEELSKLKSINFDQEKLGKDFLLVCLENDRLHQIIKDFYSEQQQQQINITANSQFEFKTQQIQIDRLETELQDIDTKHQEQLQKITKNYEFNIQEQDSQYNQKILLLQDQLAHSQAKEQQLIQNVRALQLELKEVEKQMSQNQNQVSLLNMSQTMQQQQQNVPSSQQKQLSLSQTSPLGDSATALQYSISTNMLGKHVNNTSRKCVELTDENNQLKFKIKEIQHNSYLKINALEGKIQSQQQELMRLNSIVRSRYSNQQW